MTMLNATLSDIRRRLDIADKKAAEHNLFLSLYDLRDVVNAGKPLAARKSVTPKEKQFTAHNVLAILNGLADKFDTDISENGLKGSASTRRNYLYCCQRLSEFIRETRYPVCDFSKLDRIFYRKYTSWLNERKKYSASTVMLSVNCVRNLHNKAYLMGLTDVPACPVTTQAPAGSAGTKVYLSETELHKLSQITVRTPGEKKALDVFLLASYTGLRFSDVIRLNEAVISNGTIKLFQKKTHGFVLVPVLKEVSDIVLNYYHSPDGFPKLNLLFPAVYKKRRGGTSQRFYQGT